jgi:hypothetical protein
MTLVQIEGTETKQDLRKHSRRASKVFKVPLDEVTDQQRKEVKDAINLSHYTFGDMPPSRHLSMEEFFAELQKTPRTWAVHPDGRIGQSDSKMICPALGVCRSVIARYPRASVCFSFNGNEIYSAADNRPGHNPEVRRRLLETCGLLTD